MNVTKETPLSARRIVTQDGLYLIDFSLFNYRSEVAFANEVCFLETIDN